MAAEYAELHCHSSFSFLDGASNPEELVYWAKQLGLAALAITDHDDLGGVVRFAHTANELSVPAIIGAELTLDDESHITLLSADLQGYKNLCHLITHARGACERGSPRVSLSLLAERSSGLIALSGCPHGMVARSIAHSVSCCDEDTVARAMRNQQVHNPEHQPLHQQPLHQQPLHQQPLHQSLHHQPLHHQPLCQPVFAHGQVQQFERKSVSLFREPVRKRLQTAAEKLDALHQIFGENLFIEVWNHYLHQEALIAKELVDLSAATGIPWVVTNNVHYSRPEKRIIHDVLTCIRHEVTLATAGRRLRPNGSWYMKSPEEMAHLWRHDLTGIKNTLVVAERCKFRHGLLRPPLPAFAIPAEFKSSVSSDNGLLEKLVWEGAAVRYSNLTERHINQINHELNMISRMELAPYFLIMWDIVHFAREKGIAVQGRGSAANSAVCYCLFITAVDPIGMDLLFERFLSEGRNEPPDIDLDIAHQEREIVLQYVYEKYGRDHAAMVCEIITYRGRSAVRDAARVLGFSQDQADRLATMSSYSEAADAAKHLLDAGAAEAGLDVKDRRVQLLIKIVAGLHQLPRHRSIHVGGFVLSGELLGDIVPVEPASMAGRTVIQWDKDDLDLAGLIKIDLLGLGMLMMIQKALSLVKQHRDIDIDLGRLNMRDPGIYRMLQKADTVGLFQVESRAQMSILPKLNPTCFYDIVVSIALVRPGPIQGNIIHPYLRRRRGEEPVTYLHPSLVPILKRTLGVPLFQEQGMRLAVVAAGFTPSQADHLRRVMSHKRSMEKMDKLCADLAIGMRANEFTEDAIATITHQLRAFANYGFPESHAASFSLLVYASAFLKLYFPAEFYCAMLNSQPMGFYSPATLIRDAIRHGVEVRPPDLSKSMWDCTMEICESEICESETERKEKNDLPFAYAIGDNTQDLEAPHTFRALNLEDLIERDQLNPIEADVVRTLDPEGSYVSAPTGPRFALRVGLRYVRGLGKKAQTALENAWQCGGLFTTFDDVLHRSGLGPNELKLLARAGAFESLFAGRREALWETLARLQKRAETPLLDLLDNRPQEKYMPEMSELEQINADYTTLGLSTGTHPMTFYREWAAGNKIKSCLQMNQTENGKRITVAGGVICRQRPETAKGFVFLTIEDETGMANVIIKPALFEDYRKVFMASYLAITGLLQSEQGVVNLLAEKAELLPPLEHNAHLPHRDFH